MVAQVDNPLLQALGDQRVLILDGGLGSELEVAGQDLSDALWSARLLRDNPAAIEQVHRRYLEAGAQCIETASYQASFAGFAAVGIGAEAAEQLLRRSVQLALAARDAVQPSALVAASVGPYGGALADGSEFTGVYDLDERGLFDWHAPRFAVLADSGADLLACETIPSWPEAKALARLIEENRSWAWVSFSCRDGVHVSDGTPIAECAALLEKVEHVAGIGVNCTPPQRIDSLLAEVRRQTNKPIVVYPNLGRTWDAVSKSWIGEPSAVDRVDLARRWLAAGASVIGGCCGTGPAQIRALRAALTACPGA